MWIWRTDLRAHKTDMVSPLTATTCLRTSGFAEWSREQCINDCSDVDAMVSTNVTTLRFEIAPSTLWNESSNWMALEDFQEWALWQPADLLLSHTELVEPHDIGRLVPLLDLTPWVGTLSDLEVDIHNDLLCCLRVKDCIVWVLPLALQNRRIEEPNECQTWRTVVILAVAKSCSFLTEWNSWSWTWFWQRASRPTIGLTTYSTIKVMFATTLWMMYATCFWTRIWSSPPLFTLTRWPEWSLGWTIDFRAVDATSLGDRFLSSAGTGNIYEGAKLQPKCWIKIVRPLVQENLSSTGAGVWRKAPRAFSDSSSVLDKLQSAILLYRWALPMVLEPIGRGRLELTSMISTFDLCPNWCDWSWVCDDLIRSRGQGEELRKEVVVVLEWWGRVPEVVWVDQVT